MVADPAAARNRFCGQGMLDPAGRSAAVVRIGLIEVVPYGPIPRGQVTATGC
jgi:hypothetical protein